MHSLSFMFLRTLSFCCLLILSLVPAHAEVDLQVFWSLHCPHCLEALPQIRELAVQHPWLTVREFEITQSEANLQRFQAEAAAHGEIAQAVPTLFYCGRMEVGWDGDSQARERFLARLADCRSGLPPSAAPPVSQLSLPLIGSVDPGELSLPLLTIILAGLDAFNPCAFFVLLFLLSLLAHQRRRGRMLLIGGVFVACSGIMYFAFMAAWLNVFIVVGSLSWISLGAGLAALLVGLVNIKDFFAFRQCVSLSISEAGKADIFRRVRMLLQTERLPTMLLATVLLAMAANFYELLCTAGFPMVYTRILTLREGGSGQYYLYLLLYNLIYILPLLLIVIGFVRTLGSRKLSERQGRLLKLLSGQMMLGLGALLLIAPEQLDRPLQALLLPLLAGLLTWLAARLTREPKA